MNNYVPHKHELMLAKNPGESVRDYTRRYTYFTDRSLSYGLMAAMYKPVIVPCGVSLVLWGDVHLWLEQNVPTNDYTWYGSYFMFSYESHALMFRLIWG